METDYTDEYHGMDLSSLSGSDIKKEQLEPRSLEVCIDSLESALNAIHGGADELEVCSSLAEGGLTPTVGLVKMIQNVVQNIFEKGRAHTTCPEKCSCLNLVKAPKVNVMLRCRAGSDFHYNHLEMDTMLADLAVFKTMEIDRFVFGALDNNQNIDKDYCLKVVKSASPIAVTFHRAFDVCKDPMKSLESVIELGFDRVLTSGQKSSAVDPEAIKVLETLTKMYGSKIQIMPGAGLTSSNAGLLKNIPCKIFHGSCKMLKSRCDGLAMGSSDQSGYYVTDMDEVVNLKRALNE